MNSSVSLCLSGEGKNNMSRFRGGCGFLLATLGVIALPATVTAPADTPPLRAENSKALPPLLRDVGIDQRLNQQVPLDLEFRDETGKAVRLGDYLGHKPAVLALVYYQCPMLC